LLALRRRGAEEWPAVERHLPSTFLLLQVQLALSAVKLENKDTFGKSDPFVRISKARENGAWVPVLKTEVNKAVLGAQFCWLLGIPLDAVAVPLLPV
jgi:hypothetical protein